MKKGTLEMSTHSTDTGRASGDMCYGIGSKHRMPSLSYHVSVQPDSVNVFVPLPLRHTTKSQIQKMDTD